MEALEPRLTYPAVVRVGHAVNVVSLLLMIMSRPQIFNAHPTRYASDDSDARLLGRRRLGTLGWDLAGIT